jgi:serine O-acetyltransferase
LLLALAEDARMFRYHRGERLPPDAGWDKWLDAFRLLFDADDFAAVALYRLRTALAARSVPFLPRLLHFASVALFRVRIGDFIVLGEGVYVPHGNVVVDGITEIGRHVVLAPWTTVGVVQGSPMGPKVADDVFVGTGAKVLGEITIGERARIGANSVVVSDVPADATAIGAPARIMGVQGDEPANETWPEHSSKV